MWAFMQVKTGAGLFQWSCLLSICLFYWGQGGSSVHTGSDDVHRPGEGRLEGKMGWWVGGLEMCWLACRPISDSKHSATFPFPPNAPEAEHATAFRNLSLTATHSSENLHYLSWVQIRDGNLKGFSLLPKVTMFFYYTYIYIIAYITLGYSSATVSRQYIFFSDLNMLSNVKDISTTITNSFKQNIYITLDLSVSS